MKSDLPVKIKSYLSSKVENKWLNLEVKKNYQLVIVIPAIKEFENLPIVLKSLDKCEKEFLNRTLILIVINNSETADKEIIDNNLRTIEYISNFKTRPDINLNIEFIDAASTGNALPAKNAGVGLARKIGMDQALLYFDYTKQGNGIICLDADCEVADNYLSAIYYHFQNKNKAAAVIKYKHKLNNEAIISYEIFLRYYILGLQYAASPYAHHSIGSCIIIDPNTYAKIGGMNKKKAGEDFYFLEKAAKEIKIDRLNTTTVYPSSRRSWRVPFGTGRSVTRFYNDERDEYLLYDPTTFRILKDFLQVYFRENNPQDILLSSENISQSLLKFLTKNNFINNMNRIKENSKTTEQLKYQKKLWFDGFKTMKLIHYLRDNGYPQKQMFLALNEFFDILKISFNKSHDETIPNSNKQKEYLYKLRELTI